VRRWCVSELRPQRGAGVGCMFISEGSEVYVGLGLVGYGEALWLGRKGGGE
jgi:hypothetical protein